MNNLCDKLNLLGFNKALQSDILQQRSTSEYAKNRTTATEARNSKFALGFSSNTARNVVLVTHLKWGQSRVKPFENCTAL